MTLFLAARLAFALFSASALAGDSGPANKNSRPKSRLRLEPYAFSTQRGDTVEAELGHFRVPENRKIRGSRSIELAFVRFKGRHAGRGVPLVFLSGGPGASGIDAARGPGFSLFMDLRESGDVIALDQRGTGMSQGDVNCVRIWDFPLDTPGDPGELLPTVRERLRECAQDVKARGIDLDGYNTEQSADDLEALREALGVKQIRVWAVSYGTHLALSAIRRHPASIERAVLAGVQGPDDGMMRSPAAVDAQIDRLTEHLKTDPTTRKAFPDFRRQLVSLLAELAEKPAVAPVPDKKTARRPEIAVGRWDLAFFARPRVSQTWGVRSLPEFLGPMTDHDFTPLAAAALDYRRAPVGSMMPWATICASGVSPARLRELQDEARSAILGAAVNFPFPDACAGVNVRTLGSRFRSPVRSNVPVLFISGSLDGETPPGRTNETAAGFPRGTSLIVPGASHGFDLFYFRPEVRTAILEFLASP